ncbi:ribose 5-phosphate isomerase A [Nematocida minor]|uniref:ribose 5-phosphate isomerase A n=1 Tax=Nematocida minor TaxID=1912983 RepID=UPI00221E6F73|nr:ribose 5-phosphate isomerase A [Nematocida minor]XP_051332117.1 ribose 5-phosphate isomerase A [Nematocida minor]KAI5188847.1 ribose 5-phosphate isomerase A [Nematocida minor]KAI5188951.1 ribose 5-phosphate isomerase A [Nematocida minor]
MRKQYSTYEKIVESYLERKDGERIVLGMGSGRTATRLLDACAHIGRNREGVVFAGTSTETEMALQRHGVATASMQTTEHIDLYFDGADYVDANGWMIKGYGGAILQEKIAMCISSLCVIVVPFSKCVPSFANLYVPVEIVKPSLSLFKSHLEKNRCAYKIRHSESNVYVTYLGNMIIDVLYQENLLALLDVPGVVAHGLIPPDKKIEIAIIENPLY